MDQERGEKPVLEGTVSSIIFQNEENGYTILRLDAGEEEMTVVGSMPGVSPGEYLTARGEWVRHGQGHRPAAGGGIWGGGPQRH